MVKLAICKNPWKIIIHIQLPRLPWYARARFGPIVIPIKTYNSEGVTKINSVTVGKASILGIINIMRAELRINAFVRWDCTKPAYNRELRWNYNRGYDDGKPGPDENKHYYKFHIRFELKKKRFPCFCYRCSRCEDLINKQGHFGEGPRSCIKDAILYDIDLRQRNKRIRERINEEKRCMRSRRCKVDITRDDLI